MSQIIEFPSQLIDYSPDLLGDAELTRLYHWHTGRVADRETMLDHFNSNYDDAEFSVLFTRYCRGDN